MPTPDELTRQTSREIASEIAQLHAAVTALEAQRPILGDAVVETALGSLREKLTALESAAQPEQQRKLATILFMDMAGHTQAIRDLDPEENLAIIDRALARLAEPVAQFGGRVVRFQGDGFKAVFGLPTAQENDPESAVRAALAIQETASQITKELAANHAMTGFQVRVGINTGLIVGGGLTEGEDAVSGMPVNLAARLESAAEPGMIFISHDTYRHIRGVFDVQPLDPIIVKGFPDPIPVYRVLRAKSRSFRTRRRGVEGVETRMIGRDREIAQLQEIFTQVAESSQCQVAVIVGDAGLGKSRLLYEFENWVDLYPANVRLFRGRARPETQRLPYGLLRNLFAFRCGIYDDDPAEVARDKFIIGFSEVLSHSFGNAPIGGALVEIIEMEAHLVGHLVGYDFSTSPHVQPLLTRPQQLRDQALFYLTNYFRIAAELTPVLILLEDLHWADDSSLELIRALTLALRDRPVMVLGATRPSLDERRPQWLVEMENLSWFQRINLNLLAEVDSQQLVGELLQKMDAIPDTLRDLIVTRAEGNPFYVEEIIRMLIDDGVITTGEAWQALPERLAGVQIPPTLTGVLQARLDGLPPAEKETLQRASVVGRLFWDAAVDYINQTPAEAWSALRTREIIFLKEDTAFEGTHEYLFKHALLRDVAYESVLRRLRRAYHGRAAEWLVQASGDRVDEYADLIATHYALAEDTTQEAKWQAQAGKQAAARYAHAEAIRALSRALELTPDEDLATRYELLLQREAIYYRQGERAAQAADLDALERIVAAESPLEQQAEVALRRTVYLLLVGEYTASISVAEQALLLAEALHDNERQARGLHGLGVGHMHLGDYGQARDYFQRALQLAGAAEAKAIQMETLRMSAVVAEEQGDITGQNDAYQKALELARELHDRLGERRALNSLGIVAQNVGDYTMAEVYLQESLSIARSIGDRLGEGVVLGNMGATTCTLGNYEQARTLYEQALHLAQETEDWVGINVALLNLAYITFLTGDTEGGLAHYAEALRNVEQMGDRPLRGYILNGIGRVLVESGRTAEALATLHAAIALRDDLSQPHLVAESRAYLAEALATLGDLSGALSEAEAVLSFVEEGQLETDDDTRRVLLALYRVLHAAGDERANTVLERAHRELQATAAKLDEPTRCAYLENVPWNRAIMTAMQK
jgi:predicted ATPase/class 3 adenylate cyclase